MRIHKLLFLIILLQSAILFAQSNNDVITLTLDDAIKKALDNNWDVRLARQDVLKAEEQINEAYSNAYPNIAFKSQYIRNILLPVMFIPPNSLINPTNQTQKFEMGSNNSFEAGITLSQVIYNQKVNTAIEIADQYAELSKKGLKASEKQITLDVKKAFYNILLMQELVKVAAKGVEVAKANYENISALYKLGVASEFDYLRSEVQLSNTEPVLIQMQNNYELSKNVLKNLIGLDLSQKIEVKGSFVFEKLDRDYIDEGSRNAITVNPYVQQLSIQKALLEKNVVIEKSEYYPTLAFFGSYNWQSQDNTFKLKDWNWAQTFLVGLQISYTLFDGFRRGARIEQAKIDIQKVELSKSKLEEGLKIQILQSQMKMVEAEKRIKAQEKGLVQAEKALLIAQTRFKNGVGTQLELIDTQAALTVAQSNYAQAVYDYLIAKSEWEFYVSK